MPHHFNYSLSLFHLNNFFFPDFFVLSLFNLFIQQATIHFHREIRTLLRNSQEFSFASQPNSRKKEKINERTTKFMSVTKKPSCPWNKDIIVWERWDMGEENEIKKEKKMCWSYEREKRNKIDKRVGEWILLVKISEYFYSQKLFG
jgi:3-methyladenine DNA glycosylase AlkC